MTLLRRLEDLERAIRFREPRNLVVVVPVDDTVRDEDLVVHVKHYGAGADEFERLNPSYFPPQS